MATLRFHARYVSSDFGGLEDIEKDSFVVELSGDESGGYPELDFTVSNKEGTLLMFSIGGDDDITMLMLFCKTVLKLYEKYNVAGEAE